MKMIGSGATLIHTDYMATETEQGQLFHNHPKETSATVDWRWSFAFWLIVLLSMITTLNPRTRDAIRSWLYPEGRKVVSTASYGFSNTCCRVIKVRDGNTLRLEIYTANSNQPPSLVQEFEYPDYQDSYAYFAGHTSNLVVQNSDEDKTPEIIAPALDNNLQGRFIVLDYEPRTGSFISQIY